MTTSEFRKYQEDPCVEEDKFEMVGEECKSCTPNPAAFVPDWRYQPIGVPFKNERTCQYCVVLTVDADGRFVDSQNIGSLLDTFGIDISASVELEDYERNTMAKLGNAMSFREEALKIFLEEYNKLNPQEELSSEEGEGYYTGTQNTEERYNLLFNAVACEEALISSETTISIGTPFKFLVCIDVESIFWLNDRPSPEDLQTFYADDSVLLDGRKLFAQLNRLSYTLGVFGRYASTSDITVRKAGEKTQYTVSDYGNSGHKNVFNFYQELKIFLNENDYGIGIKNVTKYDLAEEIKIVFNSSDPELPFVIDKIYAKKKYCKFEELTNKTTLLETGSFVDQTLMGYISKLPQISDKLTSPQPVTWIDFLLDYTFPQLEVIMDDKLVTELEDDPVGMFFEKELNKTANLITSAMTGVVSQAFNDWSKRNCSMNFGEGGDPRDDRELWEFQQLGADMKAYIFSDDSFISIFKKQSESEVNEQQKWHDKVLAAIGICGKNEILDKAIRCLLRGLSFNDFLKAQTKIYMKNLQPLAIQQLSKTLPIDVAERITSDYIEELAGAPLPWETSYDKGRDISKDDVKKLYRLEQITREGAYEEDLSNIARLERKISREELEYDSDTFRSPDEDDALYDSIQASKRELKELKSGIYDYGDIEGNLEDLGYKNLEHFRRDREMRNRLKKPKGGTRSRRAIERELKRESLDQATLYRPGPNLQAALTEAYVDVMLESIGVSDLQRIMDNIPDSIPIGPVTEALRCPWNSMFSPPITRFLGSTELNTVFDCKEGNRLSWPLLPKFDYVNFKDAIGKNLWNAFEKALSDAFVNLLMSLLKQAVDLVNEATCRLLGGLGDAAINGLNGGGPNSFGETLANAFKDKPDFPQNYRDLVDDNKLDKVMEGYGIKPNCPDIPLEELQQNYRDLYTAIGYALSVRELKELFAYRVENYNPLVLTRVQQSIALHAECFKDTFNNNKAVATFFRDVSSSISVQTKNEIIQSILEEDSVTPVITSICLSRQQYDDWLRDRIEFLTSLGIPEEIANENVQTEQQNKNNALESLLDALNNNDKFLEDNIANKLGINDGPLFDDKGNLIDPSCYPKDGLYNTNSEDVEEAVDVVTGAYFDSLNITFIKDLSQGRSGGLLDLILASTDNDGYSAHEWKSNTIFFRKTRHAGYSDDDVEFDKEDKFYPKTVGMLYHESTGDDVVFDPSLSLDTPAPSFLEQAAAAATAAIPGELGVSDITELQQESTYPPSFTMEFEQNWDNFDTRRSLFLQKRTSKTEFALNELDDTNNFSINKYTISNYKTYVMNLSGLGPQFTTPLPESQVTVEQMLDPVVTNYIEQNYDLSQAYDYPFRSSVFNKHIKKSFEDINLEIRSDDDEAFYSSSYGKTSELLFNGVKDMCYNTTEGEANSGFNFGFLPDEELKEENLIYVDPEPGSTEYTKRRREKILGRAQEPHPRVHFLDPEKHGGSYIRPRLYIEPPRTIGWKGIREAMIPELDACEPARTTIINPPELKKYVNDTKGKIARDPRLNNASDCIKQIPFDLIINQQSRAQIEAVIKASMRIYLSEAYIYSAPVFSSIFGGSLDNYDDSFFQLVSEEMIEDMMGRFSRFSKRLISRKNYVNSFLEQCVQMYSRKYYSGEIEATEEALQALTRLEQSQMRYKYPDVDWLRDFFSQEFIPKHKLPHKELGLEDMPYETYFDIPDDVAEEMWNQLEPGPLPTDIDDILDYKREYVQNHLIKEFYLNSLVYDDIGERMFLPPPEDGPVSVSIEKPPGSLSVYVKRSNKFFRYFTRLFTVRMMKKECMIIFKELMKEQFVYIMSSLANAVDEKAPVFRVMQNITTRRNMFFGNDTNFGTFDSVLESTVSGDIHSVTNNITENLFDQMELSEDEVESILNNGTFVVQKYFKIIEKEGLEFDPNSGPLTTNQVLGTRSLDLYDIVNPESFLDFIKNPSLEDLDFTFSEDLLISDVFGTLEFVYGLQGQEYVDGVVIDTETGLEADPIPADTPEEELQVLGVKGEMGIKKGLRLLYIPNQEHYVKLIADNPDLDVLFQQVRESDFGTTREEFDVPGYTGISKEYLDKKAFIMSSYESDSGETYDSFGCAIPLVSVEIDEFDQELINLENFSDDDYRCLLVKLVESDQFKILFDYCFPIRSYVGFNLIHTMKSFYMSMGMGPDERLESEDGKPDIGVREQPDDDILDALDDTKDMIRTVFANIYSTDDFQKTFEFDFDSDFQGINGFVSLLLPQLKRFMGHKLVRRPFNKEGGDCESPVGKLFGGK